MTTINPLVELLELLAFQRKKLAELKSSEKEDYEKMLATSEGQMWQIVQEWRKFAAGIVGENEVKVREMAVAQYDGKDKHPAKGVAIKDSKSQRRLVVNAAPDVLFKYLLENYPAALVPDLDKVEALTEAEMVPAEIATIVEEPGIPKAAIDSDLSSLLEERNG